MNPETGRILISLARNAIAARLGLQCNPHPDDPHWLRQPGASFVTLRYDNRLRGRFGSIHAQRPLADDVTANAIAAAWRDPRFKPLSPAEWPQTRVEISLLSEIEMIPAAHESLALERIRPGIDGLVFEYGRHHSLFLPEAWQDAADPAEFLAQLKYKAGLPPDFWDEDIKLGRYTVSHWQESGGNDQSA